MAGLMDRLQSITAHSEAATPMPSAPGGASGRTGKYSVISIMGPQSSGKSTILNKVFGCQFQTMDDSQGRHQVTTGIWMGSSRKSGDVLVMDLEGTDSYERKKGRANFERQTALFALTLSEVLIINMWAQDIGKAAGMNVETLRSILQANLRLFSPNSKTMLLFLIREQHPDDRMPGVTPASLLEQKVRDVINGIWDEIDKPDSFKQASLAEIFDIEFFFMPPLLYFNELWNERARELHDRFCDPSHADYYLNTDYHYKKSVPPEGLYTWTRQIWDCIAKDEALNIPDQQKLLSAYRCEAAMADALAQFLAATKAMEAELKSHLVVDFGRLLEEMIAQCKFEYCKIANKYDKEEAARKEEELVEKVEVHLQYLFSFQFKHISKQLVEMYVRELQVAIPRSGRCVDDFASVVDRVSEQCRKLFSARIDESAVATKHQARLFNKEELWEEVHEKLRTVTKQTQIEMWQLLQKEYEGLLDEKLLPDMERAFRDPQPDMWARISTLRVEFHAQGLQSNILRKLQGLMYEPATLAQKRRELVDNADSLIVTSCAKFGERLAQVLQDVFRAKFAKDEDGVLRRWSKEGMDIKQLYLDAKRHCLGVMDMAVAMDLLGNPDLDLPPRKERIVKPGRAEQVRADFERYADGEYEKAQREAERPLGGGLWPSPIQMLIFLFFAWDDLWAMLRNPLYLVTCLLGLVIVVIAYQVHTMGFDVKAIVYGFGRRVLGVAQGYLGQLQARHTRALRDNLPSKFPHNPYADRIGAFAVNAAAAVPGSKTMGEPGAAGLSSSSSSSSSYEGLRNPVYRYASQSAAAVTDDPQ